MVSSLTKIDYIVVLMLENHSFDNMPGWLYDKALAGAIIGIGGGGGSLLIYFAPTLFGIQPLPFVSLIVAILNSALGIAFAYFCKSMVCAPPRNNLITISGGYPCNQPFRKDCASLISFISSGY